MNPILFLAGCLITAILLSSPAMAQQLRGPVQEIRDSTRQIHGTIRDSTGSPVPYASINIKTNDVILAYTTTDAKGAYVLKLPTTAANLFLEVRCVGFKPQTRILTGASQQLDLTLAIAASQL